jgi:hypothetical protein
MRSTRPFRLAVNTIRHPRVRRRPVALVFRRPPRTRPPAPQLVIQAGDQISVTLAPRFTVVLQQVARAGAVVGRPDRTVPSRPGAPNVVANAGRLAIVHRRSRSAPPQGQSRDRVIARTNFARWSGRPAATAPLASAGQPQTSLRPIATVASHLGSAPRPLARQLAVAAQTGQGAPGRLGRADVGDVAGRSKRLDVADQPRIRWVMGNVATRQPAAARQHSEDSPATVGPSPRRVELALSRSARSGPRREPRVTPVATVYRQARSMELPAPAPLPVPAVNAPGAHAAIDIDQLDRELWRRFEKRARTERERRGRA